MLPGWDLMLPGWGLMLSGWDLEARMLPGWVLGSRILCSRGQDAPRMAFKDQDSVL